MIPKMESKVLVCLPILLSVLFCGCHCDDYRFTSHVMLNNVGKVDLYPFGDKYGDENISVREAPTTITLPRGIMFMKKRFKQLKVHPDGVVELENENLSWTPQMSIFGLLYNEVVNGSIWFRHSIDGDLLKRTEDLIYNNFEKCSNKFKPKGILLITWQNLQTVGRYQELDNSSIYYNPGFAGCMNYMNNFEYYYSDYEIRCECIHLHKYGDQDCRYISTIPNFPSAVCFRTRYDLGYQYGLRDFDPMTRCYCLGRGYSEQVSRCAADFADIMSLYYGQYQFACEVCECQRSGYTRDECICFTKPDPRFIHHELCNYCFTLPDEDTFYAINPDKACFCLFREAPYTHSYIDANITVKYYKTYCRCIFERTGRNWTSIQQEYPDDACQCLFYMYENGYIEFLEGKDDEICDCVSDNLEFQHLCNQKRDTEITISKSAHSLDRRSLWIQKEHFVNTFQIVLAYDRKQTYVMYNYKVIENININTFAQVGKVTPDGQFRGYTHPYAGNLTMFLHLMWESNVADPGRWLYKVDGNKIKQPGCKKAITGTV